MFHKIMITTILVLILFVSYISPSIAGECGGGKVISVCTGCWNSDNLFVKVDNSKWGTQHPGTFWANSWIMFSADKISPLRFKNITALAISAMASNSDVWTYTHNDSCQNATELGMGVR